VPETCDIISSQWEGNTTLAVHAACYSALCF